MSALLKLQAFRQRRYQLIQLLVGGRPEDMVNAVQPWEDEDKARLTNFVSSDHGTSAQLDMIHR